MALNMALNMARIPDRSGKGVDHASLSHVCDKAGLQMTCCKTRSCRHLVRDNHPTKPKLSRLSCTQTCKSLIHNSFLENPHFQVAGRLP